MSNANPWQDFPHDIYERHMGHGNVRQLQMLARITGEQLALVSDAQRPVVAMLGITDGNGLQNVQQGQYASIIGMDINKEFLNICRARYSNLPLELHQIDLTIEHDRAAAILAKADLVTANLVVRHIGLDNFIAIAAKLTKPIVSATVQFDPDGDAVSHSGLEAEFERLQEHRQESGEPPLTAAMIDAGYGLTGRTEYALPNGKFFIRLDYQR